MRILIYKQTHLGDPALGGAWRDCMGGVRFWNYDVVIGIGGLGAEPRGWGIDGRITWIGVERGIHRGVVRFKHFRNFGNAGPEFKSLAPGLARRMKKARRIVIDGSEELDTIILDAETAPPSLDFNGHCPNSSSC